MAKNKIVTNTRVLRRTKPTPVELVKRYQRVSYTPMGRNTKEGLDCWGFIKSVVKDVHDMEIPDREYNLKELIKTANDLVIDEGLMDWVDEVTDLKLVQYGDFISLPVHGLTLHGGVCLNNDKFMHMTIRTGIQIGSISKLSSGSFKIFRIKEGKKPDIQKGVRLVNEEVKKERERRKKEKKERRERVIDRDRDRDRDRGARNSSSLSSYSVSSDRKKPPRKK